MSGLAAIPLIQHDKFLRHNFSQHSNQQLKYYQSIEQDLQSLTAKETPFPFITECGAEKIKFAYLSRLVNDYRYKLLFKARLDDMQSSSNLLNGTTRMHIACWPLKA